MSVLPHPSADHPRSDAERRRATRSDAERRGTTRINAHLCAGLTQPYAPLDRPCLACTVPTPPIATKMSQTPLKRRSNAAQRAATRTSIRRGNAAKKRTKAAPIRPNHSDQWHRRMHRHAANPHWVPKRCLIMSKGRVPAAQKPLWWR